MNASTNLSRRDLVKGAVLAGGAAAASAAFAAQASAKPVHADDVTWDKEADVVVIGFGGAGGPCAIAAHDAGAEVLVLEKMSHGGGDMAVSGGGILCPTNSEDAYTYVTSLFECCHSEMDESLVRIFADESVGLVDWVTALKPDTVMDVYGGAGFKQVAGSDAQRKFGVVTEASNHSGAALYDVFQYAVNERGIEVMYSTPAQRLVVNGDGEVVGCIATTEDGSEIAVKARKGVVLACGGFEYDDGMIRSNLKGYPIYSLSGPCNTGDGIRMAQAVGAGLWHMNVCTGVVGFHTDEFPMGFMFGTLQPSMIWVDKLGKRFVDEKNVETHCGILALDHFDGKTLDYNANPCFRIYDENARKLGKVVKGAVWSDDNLEEVEKGWVVQADTIAELAEKIGVDPDTLVATVDKWNEDMAAGEDTLFGRPVENVQNTAYISESNDYASSAPLDTPPFYAVEQRPVLFGTQGGPRHNANAQTLDAFGEPIPRLYSAGEMGSMWGFVYQGAGHIAEAIIFGRIAGEHAASLEPWE